jgi:hypothetical protein
MTLRGASELWAARAPTKCKFFFWLLLHDRLWTAARRKRRGLQDDDGCTLCDQEQETAAHIAGECVYARGVWFRVLARLRAPGLMSQPGDLFLDWWLQCRTSLPSAWHAGFDSLVILVAWCLWKERNQRMFHNARRTPLQLVGFIAEEAERWSMAGFSQLSAFWSRGAQEQTSQNSATM